MVLLSLGFALKLFKSSLKNVISPASSRVKMAKDKPNIKWAKIVTITPDGS